MDFPAEYGVVVTFPVAGVEVFQRGVVDEEDVVVRVVWVVRLNQELPFREVGCISRLTFHLTHKVGDGEQVALSASDFTRRKVRREVVEQTGRRFRKGGFSERFAEVDCDVLKAVHKLKLKIPGRRG